MSCYIGFELAIRSDQKETVLCALKDLCRLNSNVRNEGTLVQVKDSFILSQNSFGEISTYKEIVKSSKMTYPNPTNSPLPQSS